MVSLRAFNAGTTTIDIPIDKVIEIIYPYLANEKCCIKKETVIPLTIVGHALLPCLPFVIRSDDVANCIPFAVPYGVNGRIAVVVSVIHDVIGITEDGARAVIIQYGFPCSSTIKRLIYGIFPT